MILGYSSDYSSLAQDFITMEVPVIHAIETSKVVDEMKCYLLIAYRCLAHNIIYGNMFILLLNVTATIIQ